MSKQKRLVARTTEECKDIIQYAADISGVSLSQFVVEATHDRAVEVNASMERVRAHMSNAKALCDVLDSL